MQITRGNYSQYANMVQQMFGNKKNPNNPLAQCDYGNFALRFKPVTPPGFPCSTMRLMTSAP